MTPFLSNKQRGQVSIFMALFISTMILLFAFTTNVGMLVHAKINLQNAADAAAYAGAAVQARQLTAAAYLNYEMRRAIKEFLFLVTVRSQFAAMPCFPADASGQPPVYSSGVQCPGVNGEDRHDFAFFDPRESGNNETGGPFLPTTCIIFSPDNNYCQKASVPGIPEFQGSGSFGVADPIVAAVRNATNQIITKKIEDCEGRTEINQQFTIAWLFNVYPFQDNSASSTFTVGQDSDDPFDAVGLERVGILPRMAMLRARIDNFEEALNLNLATEGVGGSTVTDESIGALKTAGAGKIGMGMDYFERPIQAFLSARNNLPTVSRDNGIFSEIELSELIPNRIGNVTPNPDLRNPPVLVKFNDILAPATFANSKFQQVAGQLRGNCQQSRELRTINAFPYGVTKDPNILTYYAVRLQAKARLLFSPFGTDGTVTISAYSAAKPFGSRIGRDLSLSPDTLMHARANPGGTSIISGQSPTHPNPLVGDGDLSSATDGFSRKAHLGYLRGSMLTFNRRDYGMRLAGAYAPWEVGFYTPPANFQIPESIGLFSDNPLYEGKYFKLIAPIFPVNGSVGTGLGFVRERVLRYLSGDVTGTQTLENQPAFRAFKDFMLSDAMFTTLFNYMNENKLITSHIIPDPLLNDVPDLVNYARATGQRFTVAGMQSPQRRQLTSWNTQKTASDVDQDINSNSELGPDVGRSGYSVRFISFSSLKAGGATGNEPLANGTWDNPFNRLDAGNAASRIQDDLTKLKH
jgi:hypothetical protein